MTAATSSERKQGKQANGNDQGHDCGGVDGNRRGNDRFGGARARRRPSGEPAGDRYVSVQLLQAGATLTGHPASEYTGLEPGKIYYAYDPDSDTYWAAAALSGPKTFDAGVMLQDANSYMMFRKSGLGGTWVPFRVGYGPRAAMPPDGDCPLPPVSIATGDS
jgi:hypothetical protein